MSEPVRWKDLKIGILSAAGILALGIGVLTFGRVGTLHGKTFRVYVTSDAARGLIRGSEVWLDGQRVGLVRDVEFRPPSVSARDRLVIALDVLESARQHLRLDSRVEIRSGTTVIGDQIVSLSSGTARMRQVADGDTIHAGEQLDLESTGAEVAEATREFPGIIENVKLLGAQLKSVNGTLGALGVDQGGPEMRRVRARASDLLGRLSTSEGTVGLALGSRDLLMARARRAMAQTDSIRALLASNDHTLGRFRRDTTIKAHIAALRAELSEVQRLASSPNGTIGRLRTDSAIVRSMHRDLAALDSLLADMKKHPLRYNPF